MIEHYEIKQENQEDILYLYVNLSDEFASLNKKEKNQKLMHIIQQFIQENKIDFAGKTIAIIASGVVVGTLLLHHPINLSSTKNDTIPMTENLAMAITNPKIGWNDQEIVQEELTESIIEQTKQEEINASNPMTDSIVNNQSPPQSTSQEQGLLEKTYVTLHRTSGQVIELELEEYIIGVVGSEMPAAFHPQALMAQAIIARTYALKAIHRGDILTDSSSTQNYKSNAELQTLWGSNYQYYYTKIKEAVEITKGMYLTYQGNLIEAVYHSTSNGVTEDSKYVWGNAFPYLVSVESPYDSSNPSFQQEQWISYEDLKVKLGMEVDQNISFHVISKTTGNRIERIEINGIIYTGIQIRNLLGLRSTDFEIVPTDTGIQVITRGYGHGVGMSQYGANGMAKAGYSYEKIVKHYYPGVTLNQM